MQALVISGRKQHARAPGAGQHIEGAALRVDDRSRCDADVGGDEGALHIIRRDRGFPVFNKAHLPQGRAVTVGVEGIYAVMLGHDEEHIVPALTRNLDPADEERLCVDLTINMQGEELAQLLSIYIARC